MNEFTYTIVNPGDIDWKDALLGVHVSDHGFGGMHFLVWVESAEHYDDAMEQVIEYMADHKMGVGTYIFTDEQALEALGEEATEENMEALYDGQLGDMSLGHGGISPSWFIGPHDWSLNEVDPDADQSLWDAAVEASEEYNDADEPDDSTLELTGEW